MPEILDLDQTTWASVSHIREEQRRSLEFEALADDHDTISEALNGAYNGSPA